MKLSGYLRRCAYVVLATCVAVGGLFCNSNVYAVDGDVPARRLQISPVKVDLELKPGTTKTATFRVQNTGSEPFRYTVKVAPYSVTDDKYSSFSTVTETKYTDIAKWVTFSKTSGELDAAAEDEITLTVRVPRDVPAGGQYAIVLAEIDGSSEDAESGVGIVQQVGMLLYSENVDGQTRRSGEIIDNKVPGFIFNPPITVSSLVKNTGNVHTEAEYTLQVYPLFGDEEVYTNEENPVKQAVLPETQRYNEMSWEGAPALGIFRVKQTVKIFDQVKTTEKMVFLCPIWFLFIVLLLIFCVVFWIVSRVRNRRKEA